MLILKHLKTLQHVSIIIKIIFRELVSSLLKSLNLKIFKNVKSQLWWCGSITLGVCAWPRTHTKRYAAASPQLTFPFLKILNSMTLKRNLRAPWRRSE